MALAVCTNCRRPCVIGPPRHGHCRGERGDLFERRHCRRLAEAHRLLDALGEITAECDGCGRAARQHSVHCEALRLIDAELVDDEAQAG